MQLFAVKMALLEQFFYFRPDQNLVEETQAAKAALIIVLVVCMCHLHGA